MPETRQLSFLEKLAAEKADTHAAQLAKARQALRAAEEQLAQLRGYEDGYNAQLGAKLGVSMAIDALRDHHRFMQNVGHALRQQELEVARRRIHAEAIERVWQETERRRQGFRVLAGKAASAERIAKTRRDQRSDDERAARKPLSSGVDD